MIANVTPTAALRPAARRRHGRRARPALPLRPLARCRSTSRSPSRRAGRATSGSAQTAIVHLTPGPRRRLARGQRGRARPAAGRGDGRRRPAADDGPVARARGRRAALDPAAGAAVAREGRRGRRARRRRRHVDGGAARALRRPDPGADRRARPEPRVVDPASASSLSPADLAGGERQPAPAATRTRARSRSTRTCSGARCPASPGHATPVDGLWHIGASTHPGPGPRRGLGHARREAAARGGRLRRCGSRSRRSRR